MSIRRSFFTLATVALTTSLCADEPNTDEGENHRPALFRDWELTGFLELEGRFYQDSPLDPRQEKSVGGSIALEPELYRTWDDRGLELTIKPFLRLDAGDSERTHFDLRELSFQKLAEKWELRLGVDRVFWGVTESQHLVDTINQIDLVENLDTEDRLGQPMLNFTWLDDWGTVNLFYLPYFRERTFPGIDGRFRSQPYVDTDQTTYESSLEEWHPDIAARWSHVLGDFDLGLHYFYGTSRDPLFAPTLGHDGGPALRPIYNLMHQAGLDAQWTKDGWLLKTEALARTGRGQHFQAVVSGFEYTFYDVGGTGFDAGVLSEYHYDSRGNNALNPFNHDIFAGTRISLNDENDTAFLGGVFWDHENDTTALRLEFERRLGERFTLEIEAQKFLETDPTDLFNSFRRDSFLEISVRRYF
jgi:hypothetical protein